jgi:hypothetical protein
MVREALRCNRGIVVTREAGFHARPFVGVRGHATMHRHHGVSLLLHMHPNVVDMIHRHHGVSLMLHLQIIVVVRTPGLRKSLGAPGLFKSLGMASSIALLGIGTHHRSGRVKGHHAGVLITYSSFLGE